MKRKNDPNKPVRAPTDSADQVNARFASAQNVANGGADAPMSEAEAQQREDQESRAADEENEDLFADYEPLHYEAGQAHPDPVVETTSLSFAELPPITYQLKLHNGIFRPKSASNEFGGALSRLQLETVSYACQRHETKLPTGERAGFFLGDGVGLGKGRQLAGIVLENWLRGRRRHLWVSVSADLCYDSERDLNDIGASQISVCNITKLGYGRIDGGKGGFTEGVLFSTYSALTSSSKSGARLDQIVKWLGEDGAQGCILFDESHKAKHLFPSSGGDDAQPQPGQRGGKGRKKQKSTKMAQACQDIQQRCPNARVVYCSATGASSLDNMAYMLRLGLWGPGTAFADGFGSFATAIGKSGVGAMELVALDMKRRGMYISRQLSFKSATYDTKVIDLTPAQTSMYDAAANFWTEMHGCFQTAIHMLGIKTKGIKNHPSGRVFTHFWGCHQRFFRQLCMAVKVPEVVKIAQQALLANKCVVIGLQTTGEARLNDAVKGGADLEEFAGMKEVIKFLLSKFPTGDYMGRHPEEDLSDDDEDGEDDQEMLENARLFARARAGRAGKGPAKRFADEDMRSDDDTDEDEEMRGFIVGSDEEEEDEGDDEEGELEGNGGRRRGKLPKEVTTLTVGQLRQVVRLAGRKDINCNSRPQLLAILQQVEKEHRQSGQPSVHSLLVKAGHVPDPNKGRKRTSDEGEAAEDGGGGHQRRRLHRTAAVLGRSSYVELDGSDGDAPADNVVVLDSEEEEESFYAATREEREAVSNHALMNKQLEIRIDRVWSVGTVINVTGKEPKLLHHVRMEGSTTTQKIDLTAVQWKLHASTAAPGAMGAQAKSGRRRVVADDDSDDDFVMGGENRPPHASQRPSSAAGKRKKSAVRQEEDADDYSGDSDLGQLSDDEDDSELSGSDSPARRRKAKAASAGSSKAAGKMKMPPPQNSKTQRKKRGGRHSPDSDSGGEEDAESDEERDLSVYQHHDTQQIRQLQRLKRTLLKKLQALKLPENPLDLLIAELGGTEHVAEMTGRKGRLVRDADGRTVYAKRNEGLRDQNDRHVTQDKINLAEKENFMRGSKLVAIISEAASSGISLQADKRVANRRRRVHLTLELPWSADQCIQQCGRTHRSNQVHGPEYILCMTALGGERRFASTVAKRLQELGALTKADRRAADASDLSAFDVDTKYGLWAMQIVIDQLSNSAFNAQHPPPEHVRAALGLPNNADALHDKWAEYLESGEDAVHDAGIDAEKDTKSFLNRLLGVTVQMQNLMFSHFAAELDEQVKKARHDDKYDEGVVDIRGESVSIADGYPVTLATTVGVGLVHFRINVDRGISFDRAVEMLQAKAARNTGGQPLQAEGFYRSGRPLIGREKEGLHGHLLLIQKPTPSFALNHVPVYKVYRPPTGLGSRMVLRDLAGYRKVDDALARKSWVRHYDDALRYCSHGPNCKNRQFCRAGMRVEPRNIITGAVLPYWSYLQQTVGNSYEQRSDRSRVIVKSKMSIVRVRVNDQNGKECRLVGIEIKTDSEMKKLRELVGANPSRDDHGAGSSTDSKPNVKPDLKPTPQAMASSSGFGGANSSANMIGNPFPVFAKVIIHGLQSEKAMQFNFASASVTELPNAEGRYLVTIKDGMFKGTQLRVRHCNLMRS